MKYILYSFQEQTTVGVAEKVGINDCKPLDFNLVHIRMRISVGCVHDRNLRAPIRITDTERNSATNI